MIIYVIDMLWFMYIYFSKAMAAKNLTRAIFSIRPWIYLSSCIAYSSPSISKTFDVFRCILHHFAPMDNGPKLLDFDIDHDQFCIPNWHPNFEPAHHPSWKTMENTEGCELPPHPVSADLGLPWAPQPDNLNHTPTARDRRGRRNVRIVQRNHDKS